MIINDLVVEYPHGAGGAFLSTVLACCIKNVSWQSRKVNWHKTPVRVQSNHAYDPAHNIISIDDPGAKYNFWINYFKKRVVHELTHYRYQNRKWIKCPYQDLDSRNDAFWLLNQCRHIIQYQTQQPWQISWIQMLNDPATSWQTIQEFLEANRQPNHWNLEKWTHAVDEYRQTLPTKMVVNTHHARWQIWAVALLQQQGISPDFDVIDNFRNPKFLSWLEIHNQNLLETTQKCTWIPG